ncbi:MAG TPA: (2Fe-2S)-binding protein, partial [Noviherbaspirillum sp.]|nr:(2Fe-2S)-binding protein [Noviherbaspirillum sp.]
FGRDRMGVLFRAADDYPAAPELVREIEAHFGIAGSDVLRYDDVRRGNARHIVVRDGALAAVSLAGDTSAEHWLKQYLEEQQPVAALGRLLLIPSAKPPQGFAARGRIVCNCFNVAETEIGAALSRERPGETPQALLASLQQQLKCGTNCGSCVPELKQIILASSSSAQAAA